MACLVAAGCLIALLSHTGAHASIAVSPMRVEADPAPGGSEQTYFLNVSNTCSETSRAVRFDVEDFWIAGDGEILVGDEVEPGVAARYGGARFVSVQADSITLGVRESRRVRFAVRLPAGATGVYGALITADGGIAAPSVQFGAPFDVRVRFQVSVFVLITAHSVYAGAVRSPSTPPRRAVSVANVHTEFPYPTDPLPLVRVFADIANTGTTHARGRITAAVTRADDGRVIEEVRMEGGTRLLLPGSRRRFYGAIRSGLPPGLYRVTTQFVADDNTVRATGSGQFQLMQPVAGASPAAPAFRMLSLGRDGLLMTANAQRSDRREVEVRNHLRAPVSVDVRTPSGDSDWLTVSPSRFTLPPLGVRTLRVRAAASDAIPLGKHEHDVILTPQARGSDTPLDEEAIRLRVVVISPKITD